MQSNDEFLYQERFVGQNTDDILRFAFPEKLGTHARIEDIPLPEEHFAQTWNEAISQSGQIEERTAYLHIPFCRLRCLYCGFYRNHYERSRVSRYVQALLKDIKMSGQKDYCHTQPLQAVYFGGGTPGVMTAGEIAAVLAAVRENLTLAADCEITFETSISDLDDDQLDACLAGGVNRFSLGVQTFNTKIRQALGRLDTEERLRQRLEELTTKQKQAAVVIDLIYGLPWQTLAMWRYDLDIAVASGIHGFDTYSLNVQPKTILAQMISEGKIPPAASRAEQAEYFSLAVALLNKEGLRRLSVCHWGRFDMKERNIYNRLGKGELGRIPFGAGGGGSIDGLRVRLHSDVDTYERLVESGQKPVAFMARPAGIYKAATHLRAGIDQGLVNTSGLDARTQEQLKPLIDEWERRGFINRARGLNELTLAGQFWHKELAQALVNFVDLCYQKDRR